MSWLLFYIMCRATTMPCQHDVESIDVVPTRLVKTVSSQHDVLSVQSLLNTTMCQHNVVSIRRCVKTTFCWDGIVQIQCRLKTVSSQNYVEPRRHRVQRCHVKTTACQDDAVQTRCRAFAVSYQGGAVSRRPRVKTVRSQQTVVPNTTSYRHTNRVNTVSCQEDVL